MSDSLFIILVIVAAIGLLVFAASLLDKRRKKNEPIGPSLPKPGPVGMIFLWIARILVVLMVISIIGAFAFRSLTLAWIAAAGLALYILDGLIYRVLLVMKK